MDHKKLPTALTSEQAYHVSHNGNRTPKRTTQGWKILVEYRNGEQSWVKLADVKASYPIELAEYAVVNRLTDEPVFRWWVRDTLKKRNRFISKLKSRYWQTTHQNGVRLPHSVEEALRFDRENGDDLWRQAIEKEMKKVRVAFTPYDKATPQEVRSDPQC